MTAVNGREYFNRDLQADLTIADVMNFLAQFEDDSQPIAWYLIAEDQTPFVGLYAEDPGEPGFDAYPMIVTSFVENPA